MPSVLLHHPDDQPPRGLPHLDQRAQVRIAELAAPAMPLRMLKRTGARPFMFNGVAVATVCGVTPALPYWYELNLHRTVLGTHVCDVRLFHNAPDQVDLFRVAEHDDLDNAAAWFERYDPAGDVVPPPAPAGARTSAAELALWAARLQLQIDGVAGHYRALVGELLHAIAQKAE